MDDVVAFPAEPYAVDNVVVLVAPVKVLCSMVAPVKVLCRTGAQP